MAILRAEKMGFCFGVEKAIELCHKLSEEKESKKYILGMLVHNKDVIDEMRDIGFETVTEEEILNGKDSLNSGDIVVIRAHGTTKEIWDRLKEKRVKIYDASCIFVNKIKEIVIEEEKKGNEIVFIGDKEHPEVKGIVSFGEKVLIFKDLEELKKFNFNKEKIYTILTQTTLNKKKFLEMRNYLEKNYSNFRIFDRICGATFERQEATKKLAKEVDLLVVIGDVKSSNTKKLLEIAKNENVNSILIQNEQELDLEILKKEMMVGITAGASTPEKTIRKIEDRIRGKLDD